MAVAQPDRVIIVGAGPTSLATLVGHTSRWLTTPPQAELAGASSVVLVRGHLSASGTTRLQPDGIPRRQMI